MQLPPGDTCKTNNTQQYQTTMVIECDSASTKTVTLDSDLNVNKCSNTIKMKSPYACPLFSVYSFWNSIIENKQIVGSILMISGVFFCFFGIRFLFLTEIVIGVVGTAFVLMFFLFSYLQIQFSTMEFWLIIAVSVLIGIIVGYFISKMKKIPAVILGACCGYLLSILLFQFVLKYINTNPYVVFWVTAFVCAAVLGVFAWFFSKHVMILGTSFLGAYAIIRGLSIIAGGFPDERQIMDLINLREWDQLKNVYNYFLTIFSFLTLKFTCTLSASWLLASLAQLSSTSISMKLKKKNSRENKKRRRWIRLRNMEMLLSLCLKLTKLNSFIHFEYSRINLLIKF